MDGLRPVWAVKVIVVLVITSIFFRCVWATNHSVGGDSGWDLSSNLQAWSSRTTIHVGDSLVFRYLPLHDVLEVTQIDYIMCRTTNPIKAYTDGESVIRMHEPGVRYFTCGRLRHCFLGLKLRVVIQESDDNKNNSTAGGGEQDEDRGASNQTHSPPPSDYTPPNTGTPAGPPPAPDISAEPPYPCCSGVGNLIVTGNITKWWWVISITLVIHWVSARSPQSLCLSSFSGSYLFL